MEICYSKFQGKDKLREKFLEDFKKNYQVYAGNIFMNNAKYIKKVNSVLDNTI